jgi:hypothetical protein
MNDRELLRLAAKAAGIVIVRSRLDDPMNNDFLVENSHRNEFQAAGPWNPLTDDGDALRLAVKLELSIQPDNDLVMVGDMYCEWEYFEDRGEATRIAIVRAAAEIGKAMK